jgi:transketolase
MNSKKLAKEVRIQLLKMNSMANASHSGSALSMVDILSVLYSNVLKHNPNNPDNEKRDRLFLSKGHAGSALYSILGILNYFDIKDLESYSKDGSLFTTHISHKVKGVEVSSGSLGLTLSVATGVAFAAKIKNKDFKSYVILSDGELNEGSNWEPILFAPHHNLNNLTIIIDYNKIQSFGRISEIIDLHPLKEKFDSFGWKTFVVDGHNHEELFSALNSSENNNKPKAIIANTIKGKGVDFMEDKLMWHYKSPNKEQLKEAINYINNNEK